MQLASSDPTPYTSDMPHNRSSFFILCILGALSVISPFAIDMYLPAYAMLADGLHTSQSLIPLTMSGYFIGMAGGQIIYGPFLDRFGRKPPLAVGLAVFVAASLGGALAPNIETLIALRFLQALGGSVAGVAALAMVHDFFPPQDGAKYLSRLFLFIAVSPLLAPTIGGFVALTFGWRAVFLLLAAITAVILAVARFWLPEGHQPDASISLKPLPILREYAAILRHPHFSTYALAGAFSFAGLFTYVAGSPIIFMGIFHLSPRIYSLIFGGLACGFIGCSQINVRLLRKYDSGTLFRFFLHLQVATNLLFLLCAALGSLNLAITLGFFFVSLSCCGITYPNAAAIAIVPFKRNTGSAAALLGFLQLGVGAIISSALSIFPATSSLPIISIMAVTSLLGLAILRAGRRHAEAAPAID